MNPLNAIFSDARNRRFGTFIVAALLLYSAVQLELLAAIYAGLLSYTAVLLISAALVKKGVLSNHSKVLAIIAVFTLLLAVFFGAGAAIHIVLRNGADFRDMMVKMSDILATARSWIPADFHELIPHPQQEDLLAHAVVWLRSHAHDIEIIGLGTLKALGLVILGMILGAMVAVSQVIHHSELGPVSGLFLGQISALRQSFWRVATAQLKISALNTSLTGIYLMIVLPLCGTHLPFAKTLVAVTFICGLLPVVGNLISNTFISVISLSVSINVTLASLAFLIVVHKLEYFVNARIVGTQINVRAWEILLCMLFMERLLGVGGVVLAPVFYAWFKAEWLAWDTVEAIE